MYFIDPLSKSRLEPLVARVLIVDANAHLAGLLGACLTAFGARSVSVEGEHVAALEAAKAGEPTLIITEAMADTDPFALVRSIRRSAISCRKAPILVLTTLATDSAMQMAKDAGADEFLRKPFSSRDMLRRLNHLALKSRAWVEKSAYVGPDRRQFNSGAAQRRKSDRSTRTDGSSQQASVLG